MAKNPGTRGEEVKPFVIVLGSVVMLTAIVGIRSVGLFKTLEISGIILLTAAFFAVIGDGRRG